MPNGGSDCCGTCWFNRARPEETGQAAALLALLDTPYCDIRDLLISSPFWTYCANHPHHNPGRVTIPVGPVFVCDQYPYARRVLVESPDTEEVRCGLVQLLESLPARPTPEYPSPTSFDEQVVDQLAALREERAVTGLRRLLGFDPELRAADGSPGRARAVLVGHAIEALAAILADAALEDIEFCLTSGLASQQRGAIYDSETDVYAVVRYHAVRALADCRSKRADALLRRALADPHPDVAAFARGILRERRGGPQARPD